MIQQFYFWVYIQKNSKQDLEEIFVLPCYKLAALCPVAKTWKQLKCLWTDEWVSKMQYIHTVDYYTALKRNGILQYTIPCVNLKGMILSDIHSPIW